MIKETLKGLGLTKNEVEVYLALLNSGEAGVNEVAANSGLHRQVCYDALDRLVEKGFISYVSKDSKKVFKALDPKRILDYLDQKKDEVEGIMPELTEKHKAPKDTTDVEVVKGSRVVRTLYSDIFKVIKKTKDPLLVMGIEEEKFIEFDKITMNQYINKLRKNKLKERLLVVKGTKEFEGDQSEYRYIPDIFPNSTPVHIYGNTVACLIWGNPTYCIIVRNAQIAESARNYFNLVWKIAGSGGNLLAKFIK
jgi:HTH-type transcriptional regulator, sugar sensing transcriptional regulator